ncbi:hypothetical protein B296_00045134 [Ensete ventricosum]|uniref:Uncharacterized protein n=1 Tax=Ensete ventricosum TaxID=4639 RepID=A0A426Y9L6_ENSVE|nr:hypothetical protein B296_00045134 [Ensete ventricosum]
MFLHLAKSQQEARASRIVFFSSQSIEKPASDESRSEEQRQISRFSLFFSHFFFLRLLILPMVKIDCYRLTATGDGRNRSSLLEQRPTTVKINRYRPISGGNKAEIAQSTVLPSSGRFVY